MFDWDEVPEELGGPNQAALDVEAEVARETASSQPVRATPATAGDSPAERAERRRLEREENPPQEPKKVPKASAKKAAAKPAARTVKASPAEQLAKAARSGSLMSMMRILQMGADANALGPDGRLPLQEALASGSIDAVAALLLHGAEVSAVVCSHSGSLADALFELWSGRPPKPGELPQVMAAVDALIRPQVAHAIMGMVQAGPPQPQAQPQQPPPSMQRQTPSQTQPAQSPQSPQHSQPTAMQRQTPSQTQPKAMPSAPCPQRASQQQMQQPQQRTVQHLPKPKARPSVASSGAGTRVKHAEERQTYSELPQNKQGTNGSSGVAGYAAAVTDASQKMRERLGPAATASISGELPLTMAARAGDRSELMRLLNSRVDPNQCDTAGETPLFEASIHGDADLVAMLLLANADPGLRCLAGHTAMDLAAGGASRGLMSFFAGRELEDEQQEFVLDHLSEGVQAQVAHEMAERAANRRGLRSTEDPDAMPGGEHQRRRPLPPLPPEVKAARDAVAEQTLNQAPLACAARRGHLQTVLRLLTEDGTNPNVGDELGETPLFEAAAGGCADVVAALLLHRADPGQRSLSGGVAFDLAADSTTRSVLACFGGGEATVEEKWAACRALDDEDIQAGVATRLRSENMRGDALQHTLRKLRG